ncbi:S8 family peptidase [Priestia aryabhattai]|uniref:S8 family peptidase n=1 Tax=Priestia aryabhattai TaxID=412384 RepID=A0AAX6NE78_PRIAR|nr:S8 family peptidase [Priestia aryabhattai]MDU9694087.1 S8 family peptidase [Priestia aryabhattai]
MYKRILTFMAILALALGVTYMPSTASAESNVTSKKSATYLITFKESVDNKVILKSKGKVLETYDTLPMVKVELPESTVDNLKLENSVESVEEDEDIQISVQGEEVQPVVGTAGQTIPWGVKRIKAPYAHKQGIKGDNVSVAVIDTGIDMDHEDLQVAGGISLLDYTTSYNDDNGHGTHIAGIIGALDNDRGVVGVAPDVDLYSVKALDNEGNGKYSTIIKGLDWAIENHIQIVSMSIGGTQESKAFQKATRLAYNKGVLLVASAGNKGYFSDESVTIPAKYSSVISVGALTKKNERWEFSSRGKGLDIMAPGAGILSTLSDGGYGEDSGSSMAAAYVTGLAALIMDKNPSLNNKQVRTILEQNTEPLGNHKEYGKGLVNARKELNSIN